MVKQFLRSAMLGARPHHLERFKAAQLFLRKLGKKGRRPPTRAARLLTPHLARSNSNTAFAKAWPVTKAVSVK